LSTADLMSLAGLLAGTVAWAAYGWLCLVIAATVLERVPGVLGRAASALVGSITSDGSRALLRSALGVAAVAPLTVGVTQATSAAPLGEPVHTVQAHTVQAQWAPVEPASTVRFTEQITEQITGQLTGRRATTEPTSRVRSAERPGRHDSRLAVPDRPTVGALTRYAPLRPARRTEPATQRQVVVRTGDSLWAIAATELGPEAGDAAIAARWPQWFAANAGLVGPDPDLIKPGQILHAPTQASTQHTPSTRNQEK
ncbi:MAG: LysM peptidoglycan-binding domain-containing protein, partial [Kribbellaceae bacterium]